MATPLDLGLLDRFQVIFPFLLVIVIIYALLQFSKFLGTNKGVHALIAFVIGITVLFSSTVRDSINIMAPWFVLLFIFIVFMLMAFKIFGTTDADIMGVLKEHNSAVWWIIAVAIVITVGSLTYVVSSSGGFNLYGTPAANATGTGDAGGVGQSSFWATLFHPKVLGLVFVLLVGMFTIQRLAAK
jgi:hypothetical protein